MVELGRFLQVLLYVLVSFEVNSGFLDLEELKSVHYGINIINEPVVMGQEPPGAILLRSKYGQQYQCSYPDRQTEDEKAKQEQQEAIDIGIPELLKPMGQQSCLVYPKDWWTYEFCYGKFVKQYHMENGKIVGNLIYLGYYESEFDWSNITEQDKKRKYHSQSYTNGTICDLTSNQRRVEVRFVCEEGSGDYVREISEAETCVYTLRVHTPRVCKHPYLQKPAPSVPIPITCNPLVTPEQYQNHMEAIQEQERIVQERARLKDKMLLEQGAGGEKKDFTRLYKINEAAPPSTNMEVDTGVGDGNSDSAGDSDQQNEGSLTKVEEGPTVERLLRDTFGLKDRKEFEESNSPPLLQDKLKVKVFKTHSELRDYLKKMVTEGKFKDVGESEDAAEEVEAEESVNMDEKNDGEDLEQNEDEEDSLVYEDTSQNEETEGDSEDEKLMEEFTKELDDIVDTEEKKAHLAQYEDTIKSAMLAKFSDILQEAELELGDEVDIQADKDLAFKSLASTLNKIVKKVALTKLLKKVEKEKEAMEQQVKLAEERLRKRKNQASDDQGDGDQPGSDVLEGNEHSQINTHSINTDPTTDDTGDTEIYQDPSNIADSSQTIEDPDEAEDNHIIDEPSDPEKHQPDNNLDDSSLNTHLSGEKRVSVDTSSSDEEDGHDMENRVRVRVTRIKHARPGDEGAGGGSTVEADQDKKSLDLPEEQRKQLESTVKSELEKAGLETQGQKIEVKIITAGYFDTNKEGVHVLSEEESSAFNNMIVSILEGNNQAAQEMRRQRDMEESYSYVWSQNTKKVRTVQPPTQTPPSTQTEATPPEPTQAPPPTPSQDSETPSTVPEAPTDPQQQPRQPPE